MKKRIILLLALLIMMVSITRAKSIYSSLPASIIPENVQWIIHLDMKQFHSTRISDLVKENQINWFTYINHWMIKKYKIDLIKNTTGITLFGMDNDRRNNVVCLSGNFDREFIVSRLEKAPNYKRGKYGKYTIHKWKGSGFCTFVNNHLAVYSLHPMNESALEDVLSVIAGKKRNIMDSDLLAALKNMPGDAFLMAVAEDMSSLANDSHTSMILGKTGMAFFVAMEKNEILRLNLKLETETPDTARNIQQIVNGFVALARMKNSDEHDRWKLLENLKIKLVGNVLHFNLDFPSGLLIEMFSYWTHHEKWHSIE